MNVLSKLQARIDHESERVRNLEAELPRLRQRCELAEQQADQVEADLLLREATEGIMPDTPTDATDEALRRAKVAERQRRRDLEQAERELRLARILHDKLEQTKATVVDHDVDGQAEALSARIPKVAAKLADAWLAFEVVAQEADEIKREQKRLRALVPVKGIPVSLSRPIPTIPALEHLRHKRPTDAQGHPAAIFRSLGYDDLADKVTRK